MYGFGVQFSTVHARQRWRTVSFSALFFEQILVTVFAIFTLSCIWKMTHHCKDLLRSGSVCNESKWTGFGVRNQADQARFVPNRRDLRDQRTDAGAQHPAYQLGKILVRITASCTVIIVNNIRLIINSRGMMPTTTSNKGIVVDSPKALQRRKSEHFPKKVFAETLIFIALSEVSQICSTFKAMAIIMIIIIIQCCHIISLSLF